MMGMWNRRRARISVISSPPPHPAAAGFTLLEVLVAVAVVAIALVPLMHLHLRSLDATIRAQDLTTAVLLAQGKMATLSPGRGLQSGEEDGNFEDPELSRFRWHTAINEHVLPALVPSPGSTQGGTQPTPPQEIKIWHIAVTVRWADGQSERQYTLETYATP